MSRTRQMITLIAALVLVPALAAAQRPGSASAQERRTYQEYDRATNATFTATSDATGNAVLAVKGGDFTLEKVVAQTGDTTLRLSQGKDAVTIAISHTGFQIARGQRSARFDPRTDKPEKLDSIRSMLTGSQAVRSFKRLVASLELRDERDEDGALALSTLVDGAVVHLLDGELDAPLRIAKRITRSQRPGLRQVKAKRAPGVYYDCIGGYQVALMSAWAQFESCAIESKEYSWWSRDLVYQLCSWEWAIRSYQYIWQFIGCFLIPW